MAETTTVIYTDCELFGSRLSFHHALFTTQNQPDSVQAKVPKLYHSMNNYKSLSSASFEEDSLEKLAVNTKGGKKK